MLLVSLLLRKSRPASWRLRHFHTAFIGQISRLSPPSWWFRKSRAGGGRLIYPITRNYTISKVFMSVDKTVWLIKIPQVVNVKKNSAKVSYEFWWLAFLITWSKEMTCLVKVDTVSASLVITKAHHPLKLTHYLSNWLVFFYLFCRLGEKSHFKDNCRRRYPCLS